MRPNDKRDGNLREAVGPLLQQPPRIGCSEPPDIHPRDARTVCELVGRPGKNEPEDGRDHRRKDAEGRQTGPETHARG
jgi:hypothetical protein